MNRVKRGNTTANQRSVSGSSRYTAGNHRSSSGGSRYASGSSRGNSRRKRRKSNRNIMYVCIIVFLLLLIACGVGTLFLYRNSHKAAEAPQLTVDLEQLDSPYAVLMDGESGAVLASKRSDEMIFPASMAKIMTVLTAINSISDLDATIHMSYDYYDTLYERDASRAGFEPGEEAVIRDLLYGALLPSGAECCMELSIQSAGSETAFAELMNEKAQKMGLTQTHFVNSTGLHDDQQYSTVTEIGKILCEALKNKTFYQVFTTPYYTVGATSVHPDGFTFWSTMFKSMEDSSVNGGKIMGGKTGYTDEAGHCLASMAEIDGHPYILVTAGWAANPRTEQYHINDAFLAYNQIKGNAGQ